MSTSQLMTSLLTLERAIRPGDAKAHAMVIDAQSCALEVERQLLEALEEIRRLRARLEGHAAEPGPIPRQD
jgi:hypothetical protein